MRIHVASASASISRTLHALISLSGHEAAAIEDAEWVIADQLHPLESPLPSLPRIIIGATMTQGDRLTCPIRPQQLLRLLSTRKPTQSLALSAGWQLDSQTRSLTHASQPAIALTEKEVALLSTLLLQPAGISRDTLLADIWDVRSDIDTHTLETHLYRLRQKFSEVKPSPCDIISESGVYRLVCD